MRIRLYKNTRSVLPFLFFSAVTGLLTALVGTAFKLGAEWVIHTSSGIYDAVRQEPVWIPALVAGAAAIGWVASMIVSVAQSCKGGGIPTSVAAVRGIVSFRWLPSVLVLPVSALLSFFGGLPLGTEGPCVQMGTAIGDGVIQCFGSRKHKGWRRYVMTGGASAGFSIATAAPVSAILFSVEELHKKFSPLLLAGVSVSVVAAQITGQILSAFGLGSGKLFYWEQIENHAVNLLFVPLGVGVACGVVSMLFTWFYHRIERLVGAVLKKVSVKLLFPVLFVGIALVGLLLSDTLGTGHALVDKLYGTRSVWYLLILVFLIRSVFMMLSNTAGTTGGVFLPTLACGALIGALCGEGMIALGLLAPEHYILTVILGITAFLGATSRIPLTACVFAVEALGGIHNILAVVIATTVAYLTAELSGVEDFTDAVIGAKARAARKKAPAQVVTETLTVRETALVVGKELQDILWPDSCVVVSVDRIRKDHGAEGLGPGDAITVRYKTYDPAATAEELELLVGKQ